MNFYFSKYKLDFLIKTSLLINSIFVTIIIFKNIKLTSYYAFEIIAFQIIFPIYLTYLMSKYTTFFGNFNLNEKIKMFTKNKLLTIYLFKYFIIFHTVNLKYFNTFIKIFYFYIIIFPYFSLIEYLVRKIKFN